MLPVALLLLVALTLSGLKPGGAAGLAMSHWGAGADMAFRTP